MTLAVTDVGPGQPVVTIVHGFTQVGACMLPLANLLAVPCRLIDAPFHGASVDVDVDLWDAGRQLAASTNGGVLVAYSMGARIAIHALLAEPTCATAAVLVSGTAGIADPRLRAERHAADVALADRIEQIGTKAFVDEWLHQPMFSRVPVDPSDRALRCVNRPDALAQSLRRLGQGVQEPLWDRLHEIAVPVVTVAGSDDPRYADNARRIAAGVVHGRAVIVRGSGHAVIAERPHDVVAAIASARKSDEPTGVRSRARPRAERQ